MCQKIKVFIFINCLGSVALNYKMMLGKIIENNKIDAYFRSGQVNQRLGKDIDQNITTRGQKQEKTPPKLIFNYPSSSINLGSALNPFFGFNT